MTANHEEALRAFRMAERDMIAFRKMKDDRDFHFAITCFHAQQAIEKFMKAVLFYRGIVFPPVHDLVRLALILREHEVAVPSPDDDLRKLNPFAVLFRYDDTDIPLVSSEEVARIVDDVNRWATEVVK